MTTPAEDATLTREEFCARFKAEMLRLRGAKFDDGASIAEYADDVAGSYFDMQGPGDDETPEECAETDISYWEE